VIIWLQTVFTFYFVRIGQLQDTLAPAELKLSETEIKQLDEMF
jgi:hypothetical protein